MPYHIFSESKSKCCEARQIILRSREGGYVTQNCSNCGKPSSVSICELPDYCPKCERAAEKVMIDKNYGYKCRNCGEFEVASIVPSWRDTGFGWQGFGIPGVDY